MEKLHRLTESALFLAVALIIFRIEAAFPLPIAIPGVKLGFANIVTLAALFFLPRRYVYGIMVLRVLLGGFITGNTMTVLYGFAGGTLCFLITILILPTVTKNQIWVLGVLGAIFHNVGQIVVAIFLTGSFAIIGYLPFLMIAALFTGALTGSIVQLLVLRLCKIPTIQPKMIWRTKGEKET